MTGGDIIKVKPTEILNEFSNLLTTEIIATNVKLNDKLHKLMCFRNENSYQLKYDRSTLIKDIGNVTNETEIFVEYKFKASEEIIKKYPQISLDNLKEIPFQSIIEYTSKTGDKCIRVLATLQKVSSDKDDIAKDAKFDILSVNALQKSSEYARVGQYRKAQAHGMAWKKMISSHAGKNESAKANLVVLKNNIKGLHNELNVVRNEEKLNKSSISKMESVSNFNDRIVQRSDKVSSKIYSLNKINLSKASKKK